MNWREFFEARRLQTVEALRPDPESRDPGYPFDDPGYAYADALSEAVGYGTQKAWAASTTEELVAADPFETNPDTGLPRVWDAVLGAPAAAIRKGQYAHAGAVPAFRAINDDWQGTAVDLSRIGRVSPDGEYRRPSGDWILDVVTDPKGWWLLELAHMLAHRAEDASELARRPLPYMYGQTASLFQTMLFRVFLSRKFGLPLDTYPGGPDPADHDPFERYGILCSVSSKTRNPAMLVPSDGPGCPKPGSLCVVEGAVRIEPTPYAMAAGTDRWIALNRWSCSPTTVAFVGWELVDVVTHAPLLPHGSHAPDYVMQPMALQCASSFRHFLDGAAEHFGGIRPDNDRTWLVDDYLASDRFMEDLKSSPPLPCKRCLKLNMQSDGSPERPQSERPLKAVKKDAPATVEQREWAEWDAGMNRVYGIVEKAVTYMEVRELGAKRAVAFRKARKHAYSRKVNNLRSAAYLSRRAEKLRRDGFIAKAEELEKKAAELMAEIQGTCRTAEPESVDPDQSV